MRTEQELIDAAKTNWLCWAGLQDTDKELADWMREHKDDCCWFGDDLKWTKRNHCFYNANTYRLRPDYEPPKPEPRYGWRVYEVKPIDGHYCIMPHDINKKPLRLKNVIDRVGFGGVQFKGQAHGGWCLKINCFLREGNECDMSLATYEHPAVPVRARFWEVLK